MKRILSLLLVLVMVIGMIPMLTPAQAAKGSKLVALTFDDGPCRDTNRLLDGLAARGAHVTFFMVGQNAQNYTDIIRRAYQEGHQIANHSWDHSNLVNLSDNGVRHQIQDTNEVLDKGCGKGTQYVVRAPYGSTNSRVRNIVDAPLIYWSVDPEDWKDRNSTTVKNRVLNNTRDGSIILLHDIHKTSVTAAFDIVDILQDRGYEFVTVNELFRRRGVELKDCVTHYDCDPNGTDLGPVQKPVITGKGVGGAMEVTITAQEGAKIYYSTDGSDLNAESKVYTGPFTAKPPFKVKAAAAFNMNGSRSEFVTKEFTMPVAETPRAEIENGELTLTTGSAKAQIHFTTDGTTPTLKSPVYKSPVSLEKDTVVKAMAGGEGFLDSDISAVYYSARGNFFRDVMPGFWYCEDIDKAATAGYMDGMGDNCFKPGRALTRAQFITLLYRYAGAAATPEDKENCTFQDLELNRFYTEPVYWAYANKIVDGYDNATLFKPDRAVSRQEMAKIIASFLAYREKQVPVGDGQLEKYADYTDIAGWAAPYVASVSEIGLFRGDNLGRFLPKDNATRAQSAAILVRLADLEPNLPDLPKSPDPVDPSDPSGPSDPSDPLDPADPANPSDPTGSADLT